MGYSATPKEDYKKVSSWCEKKITELKGHMGQNSINLAELSKEIKKDTGVVIKPVTIHYQLYQARRRVYGVSKGRNRESVYKRSNFLLIIQDQVKGFDTFEEVKDFVSLNVIMLRDIMMFEKKEIKVDYNITKK